MIPWWKSGERCSKPLLWGVQSHCLCYSFPSQKSKAFRQPQNQVVSSDPRQLQMWPAERMVSKTQRASKVPRMPVGYRKHFHEADLSLVLSHVISWKSQSAAGCSGFLCSALLYFFHKFTNLWWLLLGLRYV